MYKRSGLTWSIPETIRLQREYELLELSIDEISKLHERSTIAIASRLVKESFASDQDVDIRQYLQPNTKQNISLSISETTSDNDSNSLISEVSDSASEIASLKSQVSDLNGKIDSILEMLRRSNGGSVIGMY